jgi:hypothetical protein
LGKLQKVGTVVQKLLEESAIVSLSEKNFKVIGKGKKHYPKHIDNLKETDLNIKSNYINKCLSKMNQRVLLCYNQI